MELLNLQIDSWVYKLHNSFGHAFSHISLPSMLIHFLDAFSFLFVSSAWHAQFEGGLQEGSQSCRYVVMNYSCSSLTEGFWRV